MRAGRGEDMQRDDVRGDSMRGDEAGGRRKAGRPGFLKRYLTVVGVILVVFISLGVWLKPSIEQMRMGVGEGLSELARLKSAAGDTTPPVVHEESHDWIIAVSHVAKVGEDTFYCWGAFKVTVCNWPDAE